MGEDKKKPIVLVLLIAYLLVAGWVYMNLPFLEAAALDGLLMVLLLVLGVLLYRHDEDGAWKYIKKNK